MHYITACLKIISDKDLNEIMKEFKILEEETNKEEGCIKFHAYPLEPSERKIMLWEIWENEEALKVHFTKKHTKRRSKTRINGSRMVNEKQCERLKGSLRFI